jgi:hypothetical protein
VWIDNTGRLRQFGQENGRTGKAGSYTTDGSLREVEFRIDLTTLPNDPTTLVDGVAQGIVDLHTLLPDGAQIEAVDLVVATTVSSANSSALLNIGVVDQDFSGNDDIDALVDDYALVTAASAIGTKVTFTQGTSGHGDLVGTILTKPLYITASYGGQVFQGGAIDVRVKFNMNHQ